MIKVGNKSKIEITWDVLPMDFSREKESNIIAKFSKKYGIPKDSIKVEPNFIMINKNGEKISLTNDVIENIQDPKFQVKLFEEYITLNNIKDCDFEQILSIDNEINGKIDYEVYDKFRRYSVKWIKWDNFLSYGSGNYFDFTQLKGLVLLNGEPANQSGKTTFAIDLLHFLLFGKTSKSSTLDKVFNKHLPEETEVIVEGCLEIDGVDYILELPLHADIALIGGHKADASGNLRYIGSERNFNPMMAMAADTVVAGVSEIVEAGQIGADYVETPGIFVDYLVGGAE